MNVSVAAVACHFSRSLSSAHYAAPLRLLSESGYFFHIDFCAEITIHIVKCQCLTCSAVFFAFVKIWVNMKLMPLLYSSVPYALCDPNMFGLYEVTNTLCKITKHGKGINSSTGRIHVIQYSAYHNSYLLSFSTLSRILSKMLHFEYIFLNKQQKEVKKSHSNFSYDYYYAWEFCFYFYCLLCKRTIQREKKRKETCPCTAAS